MPNYTASPWPSRRGRLPAKLRVEFAVSVPPRHMGDFFRDDIYEQSLPDQLKSAWTRYAAGRLRAYAALDAAAAWRSLGGDEFPWVEIIYGGIEAAFREVGPPRHRGMQFNITFTTPAGEQFLIGRGWSTPGSRTTVHTGSSHISEMVGQLDEERSGRVREA